MENNFKIGDFVSILSWNDSDKWIIPSPKIGKIVYVNSKSADVRYLIKFFNQVRQELGDFSSSLTKVEEPFNRRFCGWTNEDNLTPLTFKERIWLTNKLKNENRS